MKNGRFTLEDLTTKRGWTVKPLPLPSGGCLILIRRKDGYVLTKEPVKSTIKAE